MTNIKTTGSSLADRGRSFDMGDHPVPQGTEEIWRFTPVERMEDFFVEKTTGAGPEVTVTGEAQFETVPRSDDRLGQTVAPEDRVAALAWNSVEDAYVLTIPKEVELEQEVTVNITGDGSTDVASMHLVIKAELHSKATVVVNHTGSARLAQGIEVQVADGANLTVVSIQDWDEDAVHIASHRMRVGRDASLKHIVVSLGGDLVRVTSSSDFSGEGAELNMLGAYYVDEGQHIENRLLMEHNAPNCKSNSTYKGALQGDDAHAVWVGDVVIRKEAEGTETYEENRNLILTDGSRADSVPNLEIETGEIEGAGHASATAYFDENQLFYLRSRGIPEDQARRLVVRGFFAELINQIGVDTVQNKLMESIETELDIALELQNA